MLLSLIIGLSHAQELPYVYERSTVLIQESDETSEVKNTNTEQPKYLSRYKSKLFLLDPQFALAHRLSSAGFICRRNSCDGSEFFSWSYLGFG